MPVSPLDLWQLSFASVLNLLIHLAVGAWLFTRSFATSAESPARRQQAKRHTSGIHSAESKEPDLQFAVELHALALDLHRLFSNFGTSVICADAYVLLISM